MDGERLREEEGNMIVGERKRESEEDLKSERRGGEGTI